MLKALLMVSTVLTNQPIHQPHQEKQEVIVDVRTQFNNFCQEKKLTQTEVNYFRLLIEKESNFNPYATNPKSGAYGLGQALPKEKMASYGNIHDVNTQLAWMHDYVLQRYGSFANAYEHHSAKGWY